jgi:hypothetical protein
VRSVESWRVRLEWDDALGQCYERLMRSRSREWVRDLPECLRSAVKFLKRSMEESDPTNPETIEAITKALATLNEALMIQELLDKKCKAGTGSSAS